jgi:hypothetical protein
MTSTFKLFLASAAILNASAVFASEEALLVGAGQPQGGSVSTSYTSSLPTEAEISKNPDEARDRFLTIAKNPKAEFYLRQLAWHHLKCVFGHTTNILELTLEMGLSAGLTPHDRMWVAKVLLGYRDMQNAILVLNRVLEDATASEELKSKAANWLSGIHSEVSKVS